MGRPPASSLMSTVEVTIPVYFVSRHDKFKLSARDYKKKGFGKGEQILLFSIASPLFFKISAMVTTVAIAVVITKVNPLRNISKHLKNEFRNHAQYLQTACVRQYVLHLTDGMPTIS